MIFFSLYRNLTDSTSCNIDLWFKIIQNVLHPRLKLSLINALLTKIEHKKITLNPQNIYNSMSELELQFDHVFDKTNSRNNNKVLAKHSIVGKVGIDADTKYPHLQKVSKHVASELSYEQQADLHLIALRAYMDTFHIDEFQDYWEHYDQYTNERETALKRYREERDAIQKKMVEPYDLHKMQKLQQQPFENRIIELAPNGHIHRLDVMNEVEQIHFQPTVNVKRYRNDAKYVDLIANQLPKLHSKFGASFPVNRYSK